MASASWVNEFDSFQQSTTEGGRSVGGGGGAMSKAPKRVLSRKEKINEELKLLEWHKMANEAALKSALMQTKNLKAHVPDALPAHTTDDARWIKKVIEQEHIKPLEVSKDYVLEYERREKENQERLGAQVERHIQTLKTLREKLETRAELKSRTDEYRAWQKDFSVKKQAVMVGKTLEEIEAERLAAEQGDGPASDDRGASAAAKKKAQQQQQATGSSQELSNVLDSLNKLAELESRITSLEKDNMYEKILSQERPAANDRTVLDFRKARVGMPDKGPMAVTYAMRPKKSSWQVKLPAQGRQGVPVGAAGAAARARQQQQQQQQQYGGRDDYDDGGGAGGTFLTGFDGGGMGGGGGGGGGDLEERKRERRRQQALAPPGQKNLRNRVQNKKGRAKEEAAGARRHEEAMRELNKRRNEQQIQKRAPRHVAGLMAPKGASAGVRSKNKHLQDFEKLKSGFKKRRGALPDLLVWAGALICLSSFRCSTFRLTLPSSLSPLPALPSDDMIMQGNPRLAGRAGGGGLAAVRAVSQTAPAANSVRANAALITGSRVGGGGMTRRTDAPSARRGMAGAGGGGGAASAGMVPSTAPPAVLGIGGVRALRQQRN